MDDPKGSLCKYHIRCLFVCIEDLKKNFHGTHKNYLYMPHHSTPHNLRFYSHFRSNRKSLLWLLLELIFQIWMNTKGISETWGLIFYEAAKGEWGKPESFEIKKKIRSSFKCELTALLYPLGSSFFFFDAASAATTTWIIYFPSNVMTFFFPFCRSHSAFIVTDFDL